MKWEYRGNKLNPLHVMALLVKKGSSHQNSTNVLPKTLQPKSLNTVQH